MIAATKGRRWASRPSGPPFRRALYCEGILPNYQLNLGMRALEACKMFSMAEKRRKPCVYAPFCLAIAMFLCTFYVAAYLYLLDPPSRWFLVGGIGSVDTDVLPDGTQIIVVAARYQFHGYPISSETVRRIFWPANQIDRVIRPAYWSNQRPPGTGEGFY